MTMNRLQMRLRNKFNRIRGELACRFIPEYRHNPGWLVRNSFDVGGREASISYRAHDIGDWGAVDEVFRCRDYDVGQWIQGRALARLYAEISHRSTPLIIDAGANIGASCIYYAAAYPQARVIAIEPEKENCRLLRLNCSDHRVELREAALGNRPGKLFLQDPGLTSVDFRVGETGAYPVDVITVDQLLDAAPDHEPFILKIDIEGGEQSVFDGDCPWLTRFALVVIELHDWLLPGAGSSHNFLHRIGEHSFDILQRGENLFAFNNALLRPYYPRANGGSGG